MLAPVTDERVSIEITDHVAVARLVRADKHNALDRAMFEGILGAVGRLASEPGVRAVVLCGEGPSFCSGLDLASLMAEPVGLDALLDREPGQAANLFQRVATDWAQVPVPVIAAIHGACFGGGLQIALGADVRIAAPEARLSIMEIRWGLVPDMGITVTLPPLVRRDVAKELTFTGRVLNGPEAQAAGLVTRVADDPVAAALELAREIAAKSPDAVRAAKRLYGEAWDAPAADGLRLESELQTGLIGSPNQIAAVTAGLAKQPAEFTDPA
jgi:enoyl-CoA hydratase/carnithine racemase